MLIFPYVYPDLENDVFIKQQEYVVGVFLTVLFLTVIIAAIVMIVGMIKNRKKMPNKEEPKPVEKEGPTPEELREQWINPEPKPEEPEEEEPEEEKEVDETSKQDETSKSVSEPPPDTSREITESKPSQTSQSSEPEEESEETDESSSEPSESSAPDTLLERDIPHAQVDL